MVAAPPQDNHHHQDDDNASDMDMMYGSVERIESIRLDGLALLQIIKHCHDNVPKCVTGSLLGLEHGNVLELTYTFPSPDLGRRDENPTQTTTTMNGDQFQMDMMKHLRDVNVDNNKVGWYQSTVFGSFCNASVMEYQFQYQHTLGPNAVCVLYDPAQTTQGSLWLKAFRLTRAFYAAYHRACVATDAGGGWATFKLRSSALLDEVPITLYNTDLVSCWLFEHGRGDVAAACAFDRLDMSTNAYLETNVLHLSAWCDELALEHHKFQAYERSVAKQQAHYQQWQMKRKEENKTRREQGLSALPEDDPSLLKNMTPPSRLESLLITKQINTYCEQINRCTGRGFEKLFLVGSMHKSD